MRRGYGCDCAGEKPRRGDPLAKNTLRVIERETGSELESCPWRAFSDPLVAEVLRLYRACTSDMGTVPALAMHMHPSNVAFEGLLHYCGVINRIRANDRKRAEEQRKTEARQR